MDAAERLPEDFARELAAAASLDALEQLRVKYLGRNGAITGRMRGLGALAPEERREAGAKLNALKDEITERLDARRTELGRAALAERLAAQRAHGTLPVQYGAMGRIHPISQTVDEIVAIFGEMGFLVAEGPHI